MDELAFFIAGIAAGLELYRCYVEFVCAKHQLTVCDICQYGHEKMMKKAARRQQGKQ